MQLPTYEDQTSSAGALISSSALDEKFIIGHYSRHHRSLSARLKARLTRTLRPRPTATVIDACTTSTTSTIPEPPVSRSIESQATVEMFRTAILRSGLAASRVLARPVATQSAFAIPRAAASFTPASRIAAVPAVRMYSAGGSLKKEEVESRIIGILNGFDKVSRPPLI